MVPGKIKGKILYFEGTYQAYDFMTGKLHMIQQVNAVTEVQLTNGWNHLRHLRKVRLNPNQNEH